MHEERLEIIESIHWYTMEDGGTKIEIIQRLHGYTKRGGVGGSNRNHTKEDGETIEIIHMTHWYNKEDGEQ